MKVYLGKSNRSNPNLVSAIRNWLNTRFKVLEYQGGTYSDKDLKESDAAVIVLENNILGKGTFEQIVVCKQQKKKGYVVFPYKSADGYSRLYVSLFESVSLQKIGDNDFVNWGKLTWGNSAISFPMISPMSDKFLTEVGNKIRAFVHNDLECYSHPKTLDELADITKAEQALTEKDTDKSITPKRSGKRQGTPEKEMTEEEFQEFKKQCLLLLPRLM